MSTYTCPECGLDYDTISPLDGVVAIRTFPRRYRSALAAAMEDESDEGIVRRRPQPDVWSALEYTAHVVDILSAHATFVREMRTKDDPTLDAPQEGHFDAISRGGGSIEAAIAHLTTAATSLADELDKVASAEWHRTAQFPWGERDLLITMRNAVHEGSHHLRDVEKVLGQVRGRS
ncbi:MAG TPA: DinB family protein [Acidimicrobiales bacterium]|nr:DinB family protein [Acidimicrobiales bacterium]